MLTLSPSAVSIDPVSYTHLDVYKRQILLTGNAAQTDPTLGNPAQAHCEERGYTYEVVTRAGGDLCGMCVFDDGRACNAWAYFHGACTVENASTLDQ